MQLSLLTISVFMCHLANCQQRTGVEEFFYVGRNVPSEVVPRIWYQGTKGWYGEARVNYEAARTFSLYGGKCFSGGRRLSFSITPVAGLVWGGMRGGSAGTNLDMAYGKFSVSSASQYTFSWQDRRSDYFFAWSELGIAVTESISAGIALQQTRNVGMACHWDPGLQIGFLIQKWSFPFYVFDPMGIDRHFVLGATREWNMRRPPSRKGVR